MSGLGDGGVFRNPFGMQLGAGTPQHWKATDLVGVLNKHRRRLEADTLMLEHANYWHRGGPVVTPDVLQPGDVAALRAAINGCTEHAQLEMLDLYAGLTPPPRDPKFKAMIEALAPVALGRIDKTYSATVFYLPACDAEPLLSTFKPDQSILDGVKLSPGASLIMLSHPMHFEPGSGWWDPQAAEAFSAVDADLTVNWDMDDNQPHKIGDFYTSGGALCAVLLFADANGALENEVGWVVSHKNPDGTLSLPTLEIGLLDNAGFAPIADNLACALSFGDWVTPGATPVEPPDVTTRAGRRAWATSSTMRKARRGDFSDVHIIDMHRKTSRTSTDSQTPPTRTVSPHLRRPHWRSVWYGPLHSEERHQRPVWIPPTIVAGDRAPDTRQRIYRLPEPPSPDEWEGFTSP